MLVTYYEIELVPLEFEPGPSAILRQRFDTLEEARAYSALVENGKRYITIIFHHMVKAVG